ncbi:MAG: hypothetical protein AVDCRST_MAG16-1477 [uncultured Frankineae bacterium]|uniref:Uncharacterized protein n=1 Tax=uncultured Frankineae bacterium TaxID=437475 RepID=A0A6J4LKV3_9ACTN|nr:MAG: hypothetical protein AVDCRST_MAG16-1477 [uncultured Frankineae bacterium]
MTVHAGHGRGGGHEHALDLVGGQTRARGEQERHGARGDGRRLRRAGAPDVARRHQRLGVGGLDGRAGRAEGDHRAAGRHQVRLGQTRGGGAARGPAGHVVVGGVGVALVVERSDGDDQRVVARLGDRAGRGAAVAGGDDHDDALGPQALHGVVDRVDRRGLRRGDAPRQVQHADAVLLLVGGDPVHRLQDRRDVDDTVAPGDLDGDDVGSGGDTGVRTAGAGGGGGAVPGDQARHDGPVAVGVDQARLAREVRSVHQASLEVRQRRHAGVEDGDADALAVVAARPARHGLHRLGEGRGGARLVPGVVHEATLAVGRHGPDLRGVGEAAQLRGGDDRRDAVHQRQCAQDPAARGPDRVGHAGAAGHDDAGVGAGQRQTGVEDPRRGHRCRRPARSRRQRGHDGDGLGEHRQEQCDQDGSGAAGMERGRGCHVGPPGVASPARSSGV